MTSLDIKNKNNNTTKLSQRFVEVKSFYNKHFPTDRKTYNLRITFVGLLLSILSIHVITNYFAVENFFSDNHNFWLRYVFIFVAACVSYELFYGLEIGDRKQYTPWILLKFIELILDFATFIYIFVDHSETLKFHVWDIIYTTIILLSNSWVTYVITSKSLKQFRGYPQSQTPVDDNIYDTYDNV